jgi:hemerythrin superfamily protein
MVRPMTILDALKHDHDAIKRLLARLDARASSRELRELFDQIRRAVIAHAHAEEDTFYAALEEIEATEALAEHGLEEHAAVAAMLEALAGGELGAPPWHQAFAEIKALLLAHMREEEAEVFRRAVAVLGASDLERIGRAFAAERARLIDQPPSAARQSA